jgi:hypothetical protein
VIDDEALAAMSDGERRALAWVGFDTALLLALAATSFLA